ncbi:MAG TPA: phosphoribosyltransferase [Ktedonobacterales bacterium]|nr:phosphoribosyltransferase [Ktedonobacterales bacterium]
MRFRDRRDAGQALAVSLTQYADRKDVIVLALPRGGVPVGYEVAVVLRVPLDVFLVRKLGAPGNEELAMGAIASGGVRVINRDVVEGSAITPATIDAVAAAEARELERREREYRDDLPAPSIKDQVVILVDDGLATGATMRAGLIALRMKQPLRLVAAVPVAPAFTCQELRAIADEVVCFATPEPFYGVGLWYDDFSPTSDDEVRELLRLSGVNAPTPYTQHDSPADFPDTQ